MSSDVLFELAVATGFAIVLVFVTWCLSVRLNNLGFIDISWSISFLPIVIFFATTTPGLPYRRLLLAFLAGFWSLRLGWHVGSRVIRHHPKEDVRYTEFRHKWGRHWKRDAFLFFEFQALIIGALSAVFLPACFNAQPNITVLEWIGLGLGVLSICGETLADHQLSQFRANPANHGKVCQKGLWNYSRHPNYFFEWLIWVGFFVFSLNSPYGCYTVLGSGLMLYFLLRVTGVPLTEKLSVKSKGDAYRNYQRTTSAFVPWFKKKA